MDEESFELEKLRIQTEAETRKEGFRAGVMKVIYGTMIVGIATAAFPFMQKVAESMFAERIESIRRDKEIEVLTEKNRLEEQLANKKHELELLSENYKQTTALRNNHREFLQSLADEGRSKDIEVRIVLAEYYSFLAVDESERANWKGFRDHLYTKQKEYNKERELLLAITTADNVSTSERIAAQTRLKQLERLEKPSTATVVEIKGSRCTYEKIGALKEASIKNDKIANIPFCVSPNSSGNLVIEYVVIDYTSGKSLSAAVKWLTNTHSGASTHILIGRDGTPIQLVPFDRKAWHAGRSTWNDRQGLNGFSIGVELVNLGRLEKRGDSWYTYWGEKVPNEQVISAAHKHGGDLVGWHKYTEPQLQTLKYVLRAILQEYDLSADAVIGQDDISPKRKLGPGPAFPMDEIRESLEHPN